MKPYRDALFILLFYKIKYNSILMESLIADFVQCFSVFAKFYFWKEDGELKYTCTQFWDFLKIFLFT